MWHPDTILRATPTPHIKALIHVLAALLQIPLPANVEDIPSAWAAVIQLRNMDVGPTL